MKGKKMNLYYSNNPELNEKYIQAQNAEIYFHQAREKYMYYRAKASIMTDGSEMAEKYGKIMDKYRKEIRTLIPELAEPQNLEQLNKPLMAEWVQKMKLNHFL